MEKRGEREVSKGIPRRSLFPQLSHRERAKINLPLSYRAEVTLSSTSMVGEREREREGEGSSIWHLQNRKEEEGRHLRGVLVFIYKL